jgi:hypothetical protein
MVRRPSRPISDRSSIMRVLILVSKTDGFPSTNWRQLQASISAWKRNFWYNSTDSHRLQNSNQTISAFHFLLTIEAVNILSRAFSSPSSNNESFRFRCDHGSCPPCLSGSLHPRELRDSSWRHGTFHLFEMSCSLKFGDVAVIPSFVLCPAIPLILLTTPAVTPLRPVTPTCDRRAASHGGVW